VFEGFACLEGDAQAKFLIHTVDFGSRDSGSSSQPLKVLPDLPTLITSHCTCSSGKRTVLSSLSGEISTLTTSSDVTVLGDGETAPSGCSVAIVDDSTTIYMLLVGILDPILEVQKLQKKVGMMNVPLAYGSQM